jgi:hypothetical protein
MINEPKKLTPCGVVDTNRCIWLNFARNLFVGLTESRTKVRENIQ